MRPGLLRWQQRPRLRLLLLRRRLPARQEGALLGHPAVRGILSVAAALAGGPHCGTSALWHSRRADPGPRESHGVLGDRLPLHLRSGRRGVSLRGTLLRRWLLLLLLRRRL